MLEDKKAQETKNTLKILLWILFILIGLFITHYIFEFLKGLVK